MNTDHLVDLFVANLERVEPVQFGSTLLVAMLNGSAAAFVVMLATVCFGSCDGSCCVCDIMIVFENVNASIPLELTQVERIRTSILTTQIMTVRDVSVGSSWKREEV
jgi:hypothetical protein